MFSSVLFAGSVSRSGTGPIDFLKLAGTAVVTVSSVCMIAAIIIPPIAMTTSTTRSTSLASHTNARHLAIIVFAGTIQFRTRRCTKTGRGLVLLQSPIGLVRKIVRPRSSWKPRFSMNVRTCSDVTGPGRQGKGFVPVSSSQDIPGRLAPFHDAGALLIGIAQKIDGFINGIIGTRTKGTVGVFNTTQIM